MHLVAQKFVEANVPASHCRIIRDSDEDWARFKAGLGCSPSAVPARREVANEILEGERPSVGDSRL